MQALIVSNVLLWCLLVAMALVVVGLIRQIGVLHGRIAPAGALMVDKGVAVNEPAPKLTAEDLLGRPVNVGYPGERAQMLFFLSPTCPICKSLLPAVRAIERSRDDLEVVYVSDGDMAEQEKVIAEFKLQRSRYVVDPEVGMTYQIGKLPYAVLIDAEGTLKAKGLVNSREHLDSLFETELLGAATLQDYLRDQSPRMHNPGDNPAIEKGSA